MSERSRVVHRGRVIQLNVETVRLPNGEVADLEIVHHPGGAAVVAMDSEDCLCLLRQFRHAAGGWIWELPAGKLDGGEPPLDCARRELREEAGRVAGQWQPLGRILSSPGVFTEIIHLFLARDLGVVDAAPEIHEVLEIHWLPWEHAMAMVADGEIADAKTLAGIFHAGLLRR